MWAPPGLEVYLLVVALLLLLAVGGGAGRIRRAVVCDAGAPAAASRWDAGNCLLGAREKVWLEDARSGRPLPGDQTGLCDPATPGALTCEARAALWNAPHVLLKPQSMTSSTLVAVPTLVVFLPGTGTSPAAYGRLLAAAQRAGHYVVGLSYLSQPVAVSQFNAWCGAGLEPRSGAGCNARAHASMLFGVENVIDFVPSYLLNASDGLQEDGLWDVSASDYCVEALLKSALSSVEWGGLFLRENGENVTWDKVIVSGHSQGAGHAAFWAQSRPVLGAALLSGPQDTVRDALPWLHSLPASNDTWWRVLLSAHEECGPLPLDPRSFCEPNGLIRNLAARRIVPSVSVSNWTGTGGAKFEGPGGSGVVVSFAKPSAKCTLGRKYHCSVALDWCAPLKTTDIELLWEDMFALVTAEYKQLERTSV